MATDESAALICALAANTLIAGRCGDQCQALVDTMRTLGHPARQWGFEFGDETHVVAEVRWGGEWHMLDVLWRTHWRNRHGEIASLDDVLGPGFTARMSNQRWLAQHPELHDGRDPFAYLTAHSRRWVLYFDTPGGGRRDA